MKHLAVKSDGITQRDSRLGTYISELNKSQYTPLSKEEEGVVVDLYLQNDMSARQILIKRNLRYVIYVAKHYQKSWSSTADLVSAGNEGLIKGIDRMPRLFNPERYTRLVNYLSYYIQGAIVTFLYEHIDIIRLPSTVIALRIKIEKLQERFLQYSTRDICHDEIIEEMADKYGVAQVTDVLQYWSFPISTGETKRGRIDSDTLTQTEELYETIIPDDYRAHFPDSTLIQESLCLEMKSVLRQALSPREKEFVMARFGFNGDSWDSCLQKYDINQERAFQIVQRAIKRLQKTRFSGSLRAYLG